MSLEASIELQELICKEYPALSVEAYQLGNGEYVCRMSEPVLYFFWCVEDWYIYLSEHNTMLRRYTLGAMQKRMQLQH